MKAKRYLVSILLIIALNICACEKMGNVSFMNGGDEKNVSVRQWLADNGIKETYKRLRHEPESWTVEIHTVEVYVGTDGDHQDEFLRGNRPKDLLRNSIVTPSLLASILNVKYVN